MLAQFRWQVPRQFNIAEVCVRRWAQHARAANRLTVTAPARMPLLSNTVLPQLQATANALSHVLSNQGVQAGDRVAVLCASALETVVACMAIWQMGAVVMPLSQLFGPEALQYRLQDSGAVLAIVDQVSASVVAELKSSCPALRVCIGVDAGSGELTFDATTHQAHVPTEDWPLHPTVARDPAVLIYTSGTTGPPKGALIPHQALIGNLTGFVCSQNWFGFAPNGPGVQDDELPLG
jgi:acetyl-CoA synthetase